MKNLFVSYNKEKELLYLIDSTEDTHVIKNVSVKSLQLLVSDLMKSLQSEDMLVAEGSEKDLLTWFYLEDNSIMKFYKSPNKGFMLRHVSEERELLIAMKQELGDFIAEVSKYV